MLRDAKTLQIDREVFKQTLEKKLSDLPPLPAVVTRIMQTVNDPNTSAEDLNRLISMDQGLSSRMLRIVNSAYYGFPKKISTITHAVVILGFNTVRNLVLGVSAFGLIGKEGQSGGLDRVRFWEHSVATAVGASNVAKRRNPRSRTVLEEAFIAGLLHDIGELFLDSYFPVQYAVTMAYAQRKEVPILEAQRTVLSIDSVTVGRRIAEHWNFPASLVAAIAQSHSPDPGSEFFEHAAVTHCGDWLAWKAGFGSRDEANLPQLQHPVIEWLGFSDEDFDWAQRELEMQFKSAREMLKIAA